jgi:AraC-like DNA-binding protein
LATLVQLRQCAERLLLAHRPAHDPNVAHVSAIVADIAKDQGLTSVEMLAQRTELGKRALQRLFKLYVGINPKWVINRYRLHEAIAQLQAGAPVAWRSWRSGWAILTRRTSSATFADRPDNLRRPWKIRAHRPYEA